MEKQTETHYVEGCPIWYGFFNTFNTKDEKELRKTINCSKNSDGFYEITIFPYPHIGDDSDEEAIKVRKYCKKYKSSMKFTVGRVLTLIHESFMTAVDEIFNGDPIYLSDMGLCGFSYSPETNTVYPETNS